MVKINNSINGVDDSHKDLSFQLISNFDDLKSDKDKKEYIRQLRISQAKFYRTLSEILTERLKNPPKPIPDKSLFKADVTRMDRIALINLIDDIRFLLAVKYRTF